MSSAPVLVLDIDGVVSLAQPGAAQPWYATLKQDLVEKVPGLALDNLYFTDFLVQQ